MATDLKRTLLIVAALLAAGTGVSYLVFRQARAREIVTAQESVQTDVQNCAALLVNRLTECSDTVENFGALLGLSPDLDANAFAGLARRAFGRHTSFRTLAWAPATSASGDALTIRYQENNGDPVDLTTPSHLNALEQPLARARIGGRSALGGTFTLREGESAVPLVVPVKRNTGAASEKPIGYMIALVSPARLVKATSEGAAQSAGNWELLDHSATDPARQLLFSSQAPAAAEPATDSWHCEKLITVNDRTWVVRFTPEESFFENAIGPAPKWQFGAGFVTTALLAAFVWERSARSRRVDKEAKKRTTDLLEKSVRLEEDLTHYRKLEADLRISEQTLHSLMENSPGAIYVKDVDGRYVAVNRRFLELHGRTRESFIGHSDFELFPPDLAARVRKSDAQVMAGCEPVEMEESFQLADGVHINLVHKFPLIDTNGSVHGVCGIASDITERKKAEAEVRESRRQLESLLGQLPGMAFRYASDGRLTPVYVSRGAAGLTGYTAREFLETQISLEEIIHPEDRQRVRSAIAAAVRKRRHFETEYRLIDRSGKEKWVLERGQGYYDEQGTLLFIEGLTIDITQRKDAESEKLLVERRLLEGQKLESIGVLAGGIAHDFNNLLTGIIGNANLASLDLPPQSPIRNNLRQIEIASQRAAELCQQMLAYAGKGRFVVQQVEVGQLVLSTVPLLQASISKRAKLRFDLQPELPAVMSDPTQIRQIIMNLVLNASEALGDKDGEIAITTNLVRPAADWFENAVLTPPEPNRDFVRLEVRDSGCGMTPETIAKIFEPFFTTKFTGRGLGLAAVLGIIRSHQGGLIVRSVVGRGSIFALFFPAASTRPVETTSPRVPTNTPWQKAGKILVVDDEPHVLKVASGMLTTWGLSVQLANDGYEALDFFRADPDSYTLVLLDMTMPRLSGEETLDGLREIRPDVKVLFMSGYNRREVVDTLPGRNALGFIQKPFTLRTLRENLQQMLS
jgi:PAS domain S-box-containing protein